MIGGAREDGGGPRYFGLYPAVVTDLEDPSSLGRVQVKFPWLGEEGDGVRSWATLLSPYADQDQGLQMLPEVDSQVVVGFEAGDPRRPYIVGACWNGQEAQPETPTADNDKRLIKTRSGSLLEFDDAQAGARITLSTSGGHELVLDEGSREVTLRHSNGCVIRFDAGGRIEIQANASLEITAPQVNVHSAMTRCDGVVQCETLITNSVISASYTPGAGNVW